MEPATLVRLEKNSDGTYSIKRESDGATLMQKNDTLHWSNEGQGGAAWKSAAKQWGKAQIEVKNFGFLVVQE